MHIYSAQEYNIKDYGEGIYSFLATLHYGVITATVLISTFALYDGNIDVNDLLKIEKLKKDEDENQFNKISEIHVIFNGNVDNNTRKIAESLNMKTFGENDIDKIIMNLSNYFNEFTEEFNRNPLRRHYIPMNDINRQPLVEVVDDFINNENQNALLILGEYGCGKTSFCLNLTYELINKYKKGMSSYIPILVYLKGYNKSVDMDGILTNFFINKYHINNGNINTFRQLLRHGKVLLIFDGFDEVAKRVDYDVKYKVFNEICNYAYGNTKIILTCRPNYFQDQKEYKNIFESSHLHYEPADYNEIDFDEKYVDDLNKNQIIKFVKSYKEDLNRVNIKVEEFEEIIDRTHDLWDLAKRPFLLSIIIKTLPQIIVDTKKNSKENENLKINAANLYQTYTEEWLKREDSKGKTLIKASDKKMFCENLAFDMFGDDKSEINFKNLPSAIKTYFKELINMNEIDYFSHDIRSCSFLSTDGNGNFSFIHKSFMEFFVAEVVVNRLSQLSSIVNNIGQSFSVDESIVKIEEILGQNYISTEICLFISDLLEKKTKEITNIFNLVEVCIEKLNGIAISNSLSIFAKMGTNIGKLISKISVINLQGIDLSYAIMEYVTIKDIDFSRASFYKAKFKDVIFANCVFENTLFQRTSIDNCDFSYQEFELIDLSYSSVSNCEFVGVSLVDSKLNNTYVYNCDFLDSDFSDMSIKGKTQFVECKNVDTVIGIPYELDRMII